MSDANPIEDWVWCIDCEIPHAIFDDELNLIGEDLESLACVTPTVVTSLPTGWESKYEAFPEYYGREFTGYHLYEKSPKINPDVHKVMYFLEEV